MFKKLVALLVMFFALSALAGCGEAEVKTVINTTPSGDFWDGTWSNSNGSMVAEITDDQISMSIVDSEEESSTLYWKGTFPSLSSNVNGTEIMSGGDTEAMSASLLGSQDLTKTFTYEDDELSFSFSMLGTTKIIHLKKDA